MNSDVNKTIRIPDLQEEFITKLVESFDRVEDYERLNLALSLYKNAGNNFCVFWKCTYTLDGDGLYPKAIVAATKTFNAGLN